MKAWAMCCGSRGEIGKSSHFIPLPPAGGGKSFEQSENDLGEGLVDRYASGLWRCCSRVLSDGTLENVAHTPAALLSICSLRIMTSLDLGRKFTCPDTRPNLGKSCRFLDFRLLCFCVQILDSRP